MRTCTLLSFLLAASATLAAEPAAKESPAWAKRDLRVGIIGTDTSHVPAFASVMKSHPEWRITIVAAFKGGSPDMPSSANRVEQFAKGLQDRYGVEIVGSIEELLPKVDVIMLQSVDGRVHLAQVKPVFKAHKTVFIDKPLADSVEDARRIVELSKETGTPFFSASAYRYDGNIAQLRDKPGVGKVLKVEAPGAPEVSYGIHAVEALFGVMGPGCVSVTQTKGVTTGKWKDGRLGILRQSRDEKLPRVRVIGTEGTANHVEGSGVYNALVREIAEFLHTGKSPLSAEESLESIEFIIAAQLSAKRSGVEVLLEEFRK